MDLMEYQAKTVFAKHGVRTTVGEVVHTPEEARAAAEKLGGGTVVVKAQVLTGGRGKAGGVKLASTPDEAEERAREILGLDIKGHIVKTLNIVPAAAIAEEYYFSFLIDRANRNYLCIASAAGGMEIEEVAHTNPDAVAKISIDPATGVDEAKAREIADAGRLPGRHHRRGRAGDRQAVPGLPGRGRHAGRGEPAGQAQGRPTSRRSTARSRWTRTPTSGTRSTRTSPTRRPRTRWRPRPRPRASTT